MFNSKFFEEGFNHAKEFILKKKTLSDATVQYINDLTNQMIKDKRACKYIEIMYTKTNIVVNRHFTNVKEWECENKKRTLIRKYIFIRSMLKELARNIKVDYVDRLRLSQLMSSLPLNSVSTRVRNRDSLTGYPRSYVRRLGLSRFSINELHSKGLIPGLYMYTW
jgi:small subunit ribosomal protein S14